MRLALLKSLKMRASNQLLSVDGHGLRGIYNLYIHQSFACINHFTEQCFSMVVVIVLYMMVIIGTVYLQVRLRVIIESIKINSHSAVLVGYCLKSCTMWTLFLVRVGENLKRECDHLNESYKTVLSCGAVYYAVHWCF